MVPVADATPNHMKMGSIEIQFWLVGGNKGRFKDENAVVQGQCARGGICFASC